MPFVTVCSQSRGLRNSELKISATSIVILLSRGNRLTNTSPPGEQGFSSLTITTCDSLPARWDASLLCPPSRAELGDFYCRAVRFGEVLQETLGWMARAGAGVRSRAHVSRPGSMLPVKQAWEEQSQQQDTHECLVQTLHKVPWCVSTLKQPSSHTGSVIIPVL